MTPYLQLSKPKDRGIRVSGRWVFSRWPACLKPRVLCVSPQKLNPGLCVMLLVLVFTFSHCLVKFVAFLAMRELEGLRHVREGEREKLLHRGDCKGASGAVTKGQVVCDACRLHEMARIGKSIETRRQTNDCRG